MTDSPFSLGRDLGILGHDLQSPLGLLLPSLELLRDQFLAQNDLRLARMTTDALYAAQRQQVLLDNFLDYFRILENDNIQVQSEVFDLSDVILAYQHEIIPNPKRLNIQCQPADHPMLVQADRYWLGRVLSALVDNALRFCTTDDHVVIRAVHHPTIPKMEGIEVADTGRRVLPNTEDDLFNYQRQFEIRQRGGRTSVAFNLPFAAAVARLIHAKVEIQLDDPTWMVFGVWLSHS